MGPPGDRGVGRAGRGSIKMLGADRAPTIRCGFALAYLFGIGSQVPLRLTIECSEGEHEVRVRAKDLSLHADQLFSVCTRHLEIVDSLGILTGDDGVSVT